MKITKSLNPAKKSENTIFSPHRRSTHQQFIHIVRPIAKFNLLLAQGCDKLQDALHFFRSDLIFSLLPGLSSRKKALRHKNPSCPASHPEKSIET